MDGSFIYSQDSHLCHLTEANTHQMSIYLCEVNPPWQPFFPAEPMLLSGRTPILLRWSSLQDADCIGIEHFVQKIHELLPWCPVPEKYKTVVRGDGEEFVASDEYSENGDGSEED